MPGLIIGTLALVLTSGELVQWQKQERFNSIGECETIMHRERIRIAAEYEAVLSMATCTLAGRRRG
jgi:hypothetical protein